MTRSVGLFSAAVLLLSIGAQAQDIQPVNSGANPYKVIRDWAKITSEDRPWGGSNGVAIDRDGKSVWATDRCSPGTVPGCLGTKANPVHHFDESGKEIRSFGGGMFVWPHGIHVDRDGNVWVTDARLPGADELKKFPGEDAEGQRRLQVQPRRQGADDARQAGREGQSARRADRADRRRHRSRQRRRLRRPRATPTSKIPISSGASRCSTATASSCASIGKTGTGPGEFRTPARARVRFAGPADRRRPPQPPHSDPDQGRQVHRRISASSAG